MTDARKRVAEIRRLVKMTGITPPADSTTRPRLGRCLRAHAGRWVMGFGTRKPTSNDADDDLHDDVSRKLMRASQKMDDDATLEARLRDAEARADRAETRARALRALMPTCGQCGKGYLELACGPTHAALAEPMRTPGEAQRQRERAERAEHEGGDWRNKYECAATDAEGYAHERDEAHAEAAALRQTMTVCSGPCRPLHGDPSRAVARMLAAVEVAETKIAYDDCTCPAHYPCVHDEARSAALARFRDLSEGE